jgi:hypothetical protein
VTSDRPHGGASTATLELISGGASGSEWALSVTGQTEAREGAYVPLDAGAVFRTSAAVKTGTDLSRASGLSFYARGDGRF